VVASPPATTGSFPGQATGMDRTLVSPIDLPAHLFVSSSPTSLPASAPTAVGLRLGMPMAYV
jgi:hypothetical protein